MHSIPLCKCIIWFFLFHSFTDGHLGFFQHLAIVNCESIVLNEIIWAVKDKYHVISPISGTYSTKQISKQNITRDIEIKNKLTVTRGEVGGANGGGRKWEGLSRNMYKGHMDKAKGG